MISDSCFHTFENAPLLKCRLVGYSIEYHQSSVIFPEMRLKKNHCFPFWMCFLSPSLLLLSLRAASCQVLRQSCSETHLARFKAGEPKEAEGALVLAAGCTAWSCCHDPRPNPLFYDGNDNGEALCVQSFPTV